MTGDLRERSRLPPAGHPCIDEAGIPRENDVWTEAKPFHYPGTKALDQRIGALAQPERRGASLRRLQVEDDRPPSPFPSRLQTGRGAGTTEPEDSGARMGDKPDRKSGG